MNRLATHRLRLLLLIACALTAAALIGSAASSADLSSQANSLKQGIQSDNGRLSALAHHLVDLRGRLASLNGSLAQEQQALVRIQNELTATTQRLIALRSGLARDQRVLAAQMVAQYESPPPNLISAIVSAHGFPDLLNRVSQLHTLAVHNGQVVRATKVEKAKVAAATARLKQAHTRQLRVTAATLSERDQVLSLKLTILNDERATRAHRASKQRQLDQVRHKLAVARERAEAAQRAAFAATAASPTAGGYSGGGYSSHGGAYGFFPAPGTNYSVGVEPELAARLDALGKALHLHLIGISGYRSPQHSLEVGGFADDPHTRGQASDTPGVEGVPEATLNQFGLTRPFPGPAEADHIQLN